MQKEDVSEQLEGLTDLEKEVYSLIKRRGEVMASIIPPRMMGAIPRLKNLGLVEVYKKSTTSETSKRRKFVRIKEPART